MKSFTSYTGFLHRFGVVGLNYFVSALFPFVLLKLAIVSDYGLFDFVVFESLFRGIVPLVSAGIPVFVIAYWRISKISISEILGWTLFVQMTMAVVISVALAIIVKEHFFLIFAISVSQIGSLDFAYVVLDKTESQLLRNFLSKIVVIFFAVTIVSLLKFRVNVPLFIILGHVLNSIFNLFYFRIKISLPSFEFLKQSFLYMTPVIYTSLLTGFDTFYLSQYMDNDGLIDYNLNIRLVRIFVSIFAGFLPFFIIDENSFFNRRLIYFLSSILGFSIVAMFFLLPLISDFLAVNLEFNPIYSLLMLSGVISNFLIAKHLISNARIFIYMRLILLQFILVMTLLCLELGAPYIIFLLDCVSVFSILIFTKK